MNSTTRDDPNDPSRPFHIDTETTKYIEKYFKAPAHALYSTDPDHDDRDY